MATTQDARLDEGIDRILQELCTMLGADRSFVFQYFDDGEGSPLRMKATHEWYRKGCEQHVAQIRNLPVEALSYFKTEILKGAFIISSIDELPVEAQAERAQFLRRGVKSMICVPLVHQLSSRIVGHMSLHAVRKEKMWTQKEHAFLVRASELVAHAIVEGSLSAAIEFVDKKQQCENPQQGIISQLYGGTIGRLTGDVSSFFGRMKSFLVGTYEESPAHGPMPSHHAMAPEPQQQSTAKVDHNAPTANTTADSGFGFFDPNSFLHDMVFPSTQPQQPVAPIFSSPMKVEKLEKPQQPSHSGKSMLYSEPHTPVKQEENVDNTYTDIFSVLLGDEYSSPSPATASPSPDYMVHSSDMFKEGVEHGLILPQDHSTFPFSYDHPTKPHTAPHANESTDAVPTLYLPETDTAEMTPEATPFDDANNVAYHQTPTHALVVEGTPTPANPPGTLQVTASGRKKKFFCNYPRCDKSFTTPANLRRHERIHQGLRPYRCEECGKYFARQSELRVHSRIHSPVKPFPCSHPGCGKSFVRGYELKMHMLLHEGVKPFVCEAEGCGKSFLRRSDLKTHSRTHTGERPYACHFEGCGHTATTSSNLRKHQKKHGILGSVCWLLGGMHGKSAEATVEAKVAST